jgi:phosphoribosyl-ATP pyrophosphohydrolase
MTVLSELSQVLESRKSASADDSYVASLYAAGLNKMLEKIGEEATEAIIAAKDLEAEVGKNPAAKEAFVGEVADLWFHTMVTLAHLDLGPDDVLSVLSARFGIGGHVEKASRTPE